MCSLRAPMADEHEHEIQHMIDPSVPDLSPLETLRHSAAHIMAAAIKKRGGKLDSEPKDQPWGSRDFSLTDPDGFKLTIAAEPKK